MSALGRSPFLPLPVSSGRLWGEGRSGVTHRRLGKTAGKGNPVVAYRIVVHTGDLRCAGTEEKLYLELHGMEGSSDRLVFSQVCERASCIEEMLYVESHLGRLQAMNIGFVDPDFAQASPGNGWLLDRVEVTLLDETQHPPPKPVVFPAMRWVGQSESGSRSGPSNQVLFPIATEQFYPWRWGPNATPRWTSKGDIHDAVLTAVAAAVPHPDKVQRGVKGFVGKEFGYAGEDAFVIVSEGPLQLMAVADGVYGWWEAGIDSGEYSRMLLSSVKDISVEEVGRAMAEAEAEDAAAVLDLDPRAPLEDKPAQTPNLDPVKLMADGWERVKANRAAGSCTACILVLERSSSTIRAANLGDSGFMVVRMISFQKRSLFGGRPPRLAAPSSSRAAQHEGKPRLKFPSRFEIVYRSPPGEHSLGRPYQLGHHEHTDSPDMADKIELDVREGDWIVMGSDGLFDNLGESQIAERLLSAHLRMQVDGQLARASCGWAARTLLADAFEASRSRDGVTPFSIAATEELDLAYSGGKQDDITVLVGIVEQGHDELSLGNFRGDTIDFA